MQGYTVIFKKFTMHDVCCVPHGSAKMLELAGRWMHLSPSSKERHWWQIKGEWWLFSGPVESGITFDCLILLVIIGPSSWMWAISKPLERLSSPNRPYPVKQWHDAKRTTITTRNLDMMVDLSLVHSLLQFKLITTHRERRKFILGFTARSTHSAAIWVWLKITKNRSVTPLTAHVSWRQARMSQ